MSKFPTIPTIEPALAHRVGFTDDLNRSSSDASKMGFPRISVAANGLSDQFEIIAFAARRAAIGWRTFAIDNFPQTALREPPASGKNP